MRADDGAATRRIDIYARLCGHDAEHILDIFQRDRRANLGDSAALDLITTAERARASFDPHKSGGRDADAWVRFCLDRAAGKQHARSANRQRPAVRLDGLDHANRPIARAERVPGGNRWWCMSDAGDTATLHGESAASDWLMKLDGVERTLRHRAEVETVGSGDDLCRARIGSPYGDGPDGCAEREGVEAKLDIEWLQKAMRPDEWALLWRHYAIGETLDQIAASLPRPEGAEPITSGAVASRIRTARRRAQELLDDVLDGDEIAAALAKVPRPGGRIEQGRET